ncbi:MAG: DNA methyltransferase [Sinobacteraceae bacterium]|nr:DNA methyltransferase [Nevskiaceae bacterium]
MSVRIIVGECARAMRRLPDASVDAIVTDPPYGLSREPDMAEVLRCWLAGEPYRHKSRGFMSQHWDSFVPGPEVWREALRVLKPGGHLLSFFGTRTYDLGVLAIRLAGFEIRDQVLWLYGNGFAKALDVSRAIDETLGAERTEVVGKYQPPGMDKPWNLRHARDERDVGVFASSRYQLDITAPATEQARQWDGWFTALKPAVEPIVLARKPLCGTVAENVLRFGTGALNIEACRIETNDDLNGGAYTKQGNRQVSPSLHPGSGMNQPGKTADRPFVQPSGRWPANVCHDGSEEVLSAFPDAPGQIARARTDGADVGNAVYAPMRHVTKSPDPRGDKGSAARFFYSPKATQQERHAGLTDRRNLHPTVKPLGLMRWLVRLLTPPGGTILDPYAGSGSTGVAAEQEGFDSILIELKPEYADLARARIAGESPLFNQVTIESLDGEAA